MHTQEKGSHINNLFGTDVQYQVPRYQRRYVWNETNWGTLWDDILAQEKLNIESEYRGHFTGPIVTRSIGIGQLDRYEVIDGQQRLVTFQIILCAIRDLCLSKNHQELATEATRHIVNTDDVVRRNNLKEFPYKFLPTDYDKPAFQKVAAGECVKSGDKLYDETEEESKNIFRAYDYFAKRIAEHVGENGNYDKVSDLISSIKYDFTLVPITLEKSDHPEKVFESINATGRMLSEFDYLRNNLFLRARKLDRDENPNKSYSDIFYKKYWVFEDTSLYWDANRLESFLREFLMAKLGLFCFQEENKNTKKAFDVYQVYRKEQIEKQKNISKEKEKIEYEFKQLRDYAKSYVDMTNPNSEIGNRMQFYDNLKITSLRPFILYLRIELGQTDSELVQVCDILESYILRRMVCYGHNTNDEDSHAYQEIGRFFSGLIKGKHKFNLKNLVQFLRMRRWPTDNRVIQGLQKTSNETFYGKRSARDTAWNLIHYIFYGIEHEITEENDLRFEDFAKFEMPTRILPLPRIDSDLWHRNRNDLLSIGNITFRRTNDLNFSTVNDYPVDKTKEVLSELPNSTLELNRQICQHENWDIYQINERKEKLCVYFCKIWPDSQWFPKKNLAQTINLDTIKFGTNELHYGEIKSWRPDNFFGYLTVPGLEKDIEVKSTVLDPSIFSRKLHPALKVKFNLKKVEENEYLYFQVDSVDIVKIGESHQGKVEKFGQDKGYGFLTYSNYPNGIYVHKTQVRSEDIKLLQEGQDVEFLLAETVGDKVPAAINVRLVKPWR